MRRIEPDPRRRGRALQPERRRQQLDPMARAVCFWRDVAVARRQHPADQGAPQIHHDVPPPEGALPPETDPMQAVGQLPHHDQTLQARHGLEQLRRSRSSRHGQARLGM